eukprot:Nitzschia sp. Nitz4//scaffold41_size133979//66357//66656//NITZ4_003350-RA/size133979-processed-gene-0.252-mRNA-1//-1//CDS//3329551479//2218//frame0
MSSKDTAGDIKDAGRESRLSFRNYNEYQLRSEFKRDAIKKCDLQVKAFADCAKDEGLMVVFRCQDFKKEVDECMRVYNSDERWELYKQENAADLDTANK